MHQAFYRKWRPRTFDDVYGQEHITSVLRYEAETGAFSHAYLFCGSRGTGKTTCAKILAKVVNCEHPVGGNPCGVCDACRAIDGATTTDVLEMDAASNNGVDNIRDIRDEVAYAPSALKYRVYIIDEVHMLSPSAFNALLKTLEEPPAHVVFILATTELQKLPATIISRCQRFDFRRISTENLMKRLRFIAEQESLALDDAAARLIAKLAQGGMRDAISLLELCAGNHARITEEIVNETVGVTGRDAILRTVDAIADADYDALFGQIDEIVRSAKDIATFWQDLISVYRDLLVVRSTAHAERYLDLTDHEAEQIRRTAERFRKETLLYHCDLLEEALFAMQKANSVKRIIAELTLMRMCDETLSQSTDALLSRIAKLEDRVAMGGVPAPEPAKKKSKTDKPSSDPPTVELPPEMPRAGDKPSGSPAAPDVQPQNPGKRVLRPLRQWMEAVERISAGNPAAAAFLKNAQTYSTGQDTILIRFPNEFSRDLALKGNGRNDLRGALSAVLRRDVPEEQLLIEVSASTEKSPLDEIVEAAEE